MKYLKQFAIILLYSFAGDLCHAVLPFPVPGSIYGMVLLLFSFAAGFLKPEAVRETGAFLVSLLPLLFVAPTVGLMASWSLIRPHLAEIAFIVVTTTVLTFAVAGGLTKFFSKGGEKYDGTAAGK